MIAIRYTTLDRPDATCAYAVIANDQPIGEVDQLAGGIWWAIPSGAAERHPHGFHSRSDGVEWLLDRVGALG